VRMAILPRWHNRVLLWPSSMSALGRCLWSLAIIRCMRGEGNSFRHPVARCRGASRLLRYNVAPAQPVAVVPASPEGREVAVLRWRLVPFLGRTPKLSPTNAMAETAATKSSCRHTLP
jgi:hypothetical protein